jgi:hypothetical protein
VAALRGSASTESKQAPSGEPPLKRHRSSVWDYADHIASPSSPPLASVEAQSIVSYLSMPLIARQDNPLTWRKQHEERFTTLAELTMKCLACPATSVSSERLFSMAGDIHTPNRNRLLPDNIENLCFLKYNMTTFVIF